jgi:hypothetical protein
LKDHFNPVTFSLAFLNFYFGVVANLLETDSITNILQKMRTVLYGKKAANLYTQAFVQNTQARALYQESEDTYYRANDAASYDDWRRARHQWDYFYNRH